MPNEHALEWAEQEAKRLRAAATGNSSIARSGSAGAAVEFLKAQAGARSHFYLHAAQVVKDQRPASALRNVAELLDGWRRFVEKGFSSVPIEVQIREAAATDLMEQVHSLLAAKKVHPAAPVMLAGAALEEALRAMLVTCPITPKGKPGINSYASALREAEMLTAQDMKDITAWAGLRNAAAHGEFDGIDRNRAQIMADGINLFMRQKAPPVQLPST